VANNLGINAEGYFLFFHIVVNIIGDVGLENIIDPMFIIINCDKGLAGCLWGFLEFCDLYIFLFVFCEE
jgi:hypothetical protein